MQQNNLILAAVLSVAATSGGAQTVWRCGSSYSTQPCPGGTSFAADAAPSRADAAQAEKAARVDAERAAELEKARLAREKNAPKAILIGPAEPVARPEPQKKDKGKGSGKGKPEAFTASAPGPGKKAK